MVLFYYTNHGPACRPVDGLKLLVELFVSNETIDSLMLLLLQLFDAPKYKKTKQTTRAWRIW
jgi:hypothetical protein